ncbi:MAG TPA: type II toxin-antitoxin system RelE/ParE family toxin [Candidatus Hydrogenedentes bacterium]|nr:type II toxin-antitoxin system RelE/ParE family toxin [Candidatus Hydrogenedentota bacterium]HNT88472.1 type II toxin-antitoxin system RelE/ParE family toxin [Candidatus Hydrogenedentota bacterium]
MIVNFADSFTRRLFDGEYVRGFPSNLCPVAWRKLDMVNRAHTLEDLRLPPGNRLEALKGDLRGFHSIRINDQWRIVFHWRNGNAEAVRVTDYH